MSGLENKQIDQYRIIKLLGEGSAAAVYLAYDVQERRQVAIKMLYANLARQNLVRQHFLRSGAAMQQLQHPTITPIFHVNGDPEQTYLVMPYFNGGTLGEALRRRQGVPQQNPNNSLRLIIRVAEGLQYAHEKGIVHGDLKPDNILLNVPRGNIVSDSHELRVIITDFGLARLLDNSDDTRPDSVSGSLPYMSPEQCMAQPIDIRSDVYSLGILLFQLISNQVPFAVQNLTDAIQQHQNDPPPSLRSIRPEISDSLEQITFKAIVKSPDARYQSARAFALALQQELDGRSVQPVPPPIYAKNQTRPLIQPSWGDPNGLFQAELVPSEADRLIYIRENDALKAFELNKDVVTIGRDQANDIVLHENEVSRYHARLKKTENGWLVTDLDSQNGTRLERSKLIPLSGEPWKPGTTMRIGSVFFQWRKGQPIQETAENGDEFAGNQVERQEMVFATRLTKDEELRVAPGNAVSLRMALENPSEWVNHYVITVEGLPQDWVKLSDDRLRLNPNRKTETDVEISPPKDNRTKSGKRPFSVHIRDAKRRGEILHTIRCTLDILPFSTFDVSELHPAQLNNQGTVQFAVTNNGNTAAEYQLTITGSDSVLIGVRETVAAPVRNQGFLRGGRRASLQADRAHFETDFRLAAWQKRTIMVDAAAKRPFIATTNSVKGFNIELTDKQTGEQKKRLGQVEIMPYVPFWFVMLLTLLLLAGGILLALFSDLDDDQLSNLDEILAGTNIQNADSDGDKLTDFQELEAGTNPNDSDSDDDNIPDSIDEEPETPGTLPPIIPSPVELTAVADAFTVVEDTAFESVQSILENDQKPDGVTITPVIDNMPANGILLLNGDGTFTFTPTADFSGVDAFTYKITDGTNTSEPVQVSFTIEPVNDVPLASPDRYSIAENEALNSAPDSVLDNDVDVDGDVITAVLERNPENGTLTFNGDGTFLYVPNPQFFGSDTFTYRANDADLTSEIVTVIITVGEVNEAPAVLNDAFTAVEDTPFDSGAQSVLANDSDVDGDALTAVLVTAPAYGTVNLRPTGTFVYTPNPEYSGADSFTYVANDGGGASNVATVVMTITPVNDPPVAEVDRFSTDENVTLETGAVSVLDNDTDIEGEQLTAANDTEPENGSLTFRPDGSFEYIPNPGFFGTDSFTYHAIDGSNNSNISTVVITVGENNETPIAVNDTYTTTENVILDSPYSVLANDQDDDIGLLTAIEASQPAQGELNLRPDGTFTYTPDEDFYGTDSFTYFATDGRTNSNPATVTITVERALLIAYLGSIRVDGGNLFTMNQDGTNSQFLIEGVIPPFTWSPDGSKIAFARIQDQNSYIVVVDEKSGGILCSTINDKKTKNAFYPVWSPNGQNIAFVDIPGSSDGVAFPSRIFVMKSDCTDINQISKVDTRDSFDQPSWSPDSSEIAYLRIGDDDVRQLLVSSVHSEGKADELDAVGEIINPVWSPNINDNLIAYIESIGDSGYFLRTINRDTQIVTPLTELYLEYSVFRHGSNCYRFDWSPTGEKIAYTSYSGEFSELESLDTTDSYDIYTVDVVTNSSLANPKQLTLASQSDDFFPTWSPEESKIAYTATEAELCVPAGIEEQEISITAQQEIYDIFVVNINDENPIPSLLQNRAAFPQWQPE
ncbi:MAG: tandem-95 repeat protein [Anaerolineales bacterium]|nr:tandem-95 repeat protein [Anaerolineales bacterium]